MMDTYQGDLKYIYRKSMRNLSGVRLETECLLLLEGGDGGGGGGGRHTFSQAAL